MLIIPSTRWKKTNQKDKEKAMKDYLSLKLEEKSTSKRSWQCQHCTEDMKMTLKCLIHFTNSLRSLWQRNEIDTEQCFKRVNGLPFLKKFGEVSITPETPKSFDLVISFWGEKKK